MKESIFRQIIHDRYINQYNDQELNDMLDINNHVTITKYNKELPGPGWMKQDISEYWAVQFERARPGVISYFVYQSEVSVYMQRFRNNTIDTILN